MRQFTISMPELILVAFVVLCVAFLFVWITESICSLIDVAQKMKKRRNAQYIHGNAMREMQANRRRRRRDLDSLNLTLDQLAKRPRRPI